MNLFKIIRYPYVLYESLRNYYSINTNGELSILYRYCLSILYPLQQRFNDFDTFRIQKKIIAMCKWQIGQLTNVLNYLFPSETSDKIFISETILDTTYVPDIYAGLAINSPSADYTIFVPDIEAGLEVNTPASDYTTFVPAIDNPYLFLGIVTFNLPSDIYGGSTPELNPEITNVLEQINIGIKYNFAQI